MYNNIKLEWNLSRSTNQKISMSKKTQFRMEIEDRKLAPEKKKEKKKNVQRMEKCSCNCMFTCKK